MRTVSVLSLMAAAAAIALTGCATQAKQLKNGMANVSTAMLPGKSPSRDALNNPRPTMWQRLTRPVTDSAIAKAVRSDLKGAADTGGSYNTNQAVSVNKADPTSLASSLNTTPEMHVAMAKMMERTKNSGKAEEHYQKALKLDRNNLDAILGYAHLRDRQGQMQEAVEQYRLACRLHPKEPRAWNDLGLCLARSNQLSPSLDALRRAVDLRPQRKLYRNNIATVLTEMGRHDEALSQLAAVHGEAVANYNLGYLLQQRGDTPSAAQYFARAAHLDPSFTDARKMADQLMPAAYRQVASRPAFGSPAPTQPAGDHAYQSFYGRQ